MKNKKETDFDPSIFLKKYSYAYTNFQAKIGLLQLKSLDINNKKRIKNAHMLSSILKIPAKLNEINKKTKPIFLNYVITVKNRDYIKKKLIRVGIDCSEGYLKSFSKKDCPISYKFEKENLYLPSYPSLKAKHILKIGGKLKNILF